MYTQTADMAADVYTKAYTNALTWNAVCLLINMIRMDGWDLLVQRWGEILYPLYELTDFVSHAQSGESGRTSSFSAQHGESGRTSSFPQTEQDCWVSYPDRIVRRHVRPRIALYTPDTDCPIDIAYLNARRMTRGTYEDGTSLERTDEWAGRYAHRLMAKKWTGETTFWSRLPEGCSSRSLKRAAKRAKGKKKTMSAPCQPERREGKDNIRDYVGPSLGTTGRGAANPLTRHFVHVCCHDDDPLTARMYRQEDLVLVRVAKTQDFVTEWGRNLAIDSLRGPQDALWFTPLDGNLQERCVGDTRRPCARFAELWDSF
ncbi:MAG: hypothetical protein GY768_03125, partial [Planctomycetaceae bacterium]|nr:hypothetical protein [Planctomycetaceae bacterium]